MSQTASSKDQIFLEVVGRGVLVDVGFNGLSIVENLLLHFSVSDGGAIDAAISLLLVRLFLNPGNVATLLRRAGLQGLSAVR